MRLLIACIALALLLSAPAAFSGEKAAAKKPASAEFDRMKKLVGTWKGTTDMGKGPVEITVEYRLIAAGSVIEERILPDTEEEMVTMYYDKEGKLALTHYCIMGNRPAMFLKSSKGNQMEFAFDKSCGIDPAKESHMHALKIRFDDQDTITTSCKGFMDGKEMPEHPTTLKRVKS